MKQLALLLSMIGSVALLSVGCTPSASQLKKTIEENPDIVFAAIEKDPAGFMKVVQEASMNARKVQAEAQAKAEKEAMDKEFKDPKKPKIDESRAIFGPKSAEITIVEYSDFQCPYCTRGYNTMKEVREKYGDKVRVHYKHLPLDFHPEAMPAAKYFEAIALQSTDKAEKFHDLIFENQGELKSGKEDFLKKMAKKVGANMSKVAKALKGDEVSRRVKEDMDEAKKYGFSGTPGFLVNGVSVKGAYPLSHFEKIIDRHLGK